MSGSGGFYKYRCKYFYTHNCPNWVYVNNAACASCCAEGREEASAPAQPAAAAWQQQQQRFSRDVFVPRAEDGVLYYTLMEIVDTDGMGNYWTLRYKVTQPPSSMVKTTSAMPGAAIPAGSY